MDAKEVGRNRRDDGFMGVETSVRPAVRRPQEKVGPSIWRPQTGRYIELGGGYLHDTSLQEPTGEGTSSRQAPTDEKETSVGPAIWRLQEKVWLAVRRPQDITVGQRSAESELHEGNE